MGKLYTIRDACKILQLDPTTIRKWDREGKIKCIRLSNNFRRIPESEINRILGIKNNRMSFIYARVSSHDQKADLDRQIQKLQTVSPESDVILDIRSGMKFNRKGFIELLDFTQADKVSAIYINKSPMKTVYVNPRGTSSECPVCGEKVKHPTWKISRCNNCDRDYDRDRLASLAITHRGIDLCGDPFPVSASASWQSMKDEYLYIRDKPEIPEAGSTETASAANETGA